MNPKSHHPLTDKITKTKKGRLIWQQERSIFETTEKICDILDKDDIPRSELARRLGKSKGYVTQLLDGTANMTIRTISDVFTVLSCEFHPTYERVQAFDKQMIFSTRFYAPSVWPTNWTPAADVSQVPAKA